MERLSLVPAHLKLFEGIGYREVRLQVGSYFVSSDVFDNDIDFPL